MNAVVDQTLGCLIHNTNEIRNGNSFTHRRTSYQFASEFVHWVQPLLPPIMGMNHWLQFSYFGGDEIARTKSVASFAQWVASDWKLARQNLDRSYVCRKNIMIRNTEMWDIGVGDLVLLSTRKFTNERYPRQTSEEVCGSFPGDRDHWGAAYRLGLLRNGGSTLCSMYPC